MLFSNKIREDSEKLNELISLGSQLEALGLQDQLGKQNFHDYIEKVFESVTKSFKGVSKDVTRTVTETSIRNNKALEV